MTSSGPDTLDAFVEQLVETSFTLITIVEAMIRFHERGCSSADAPPIPDVLRDVLASALTPLSKRPGDEGLTAATRVLGDTTEREPDGSTTTVPRAPTSAPATSTERAARRPADRRPAGRPVLGPGRET